MLAIYLTASYCILQLDPQTHCLIPQTIWVNSLCTPLNLVVFRLSPKSNVIALLHSVSSYFPPNIMFCLILHALHQYCIPQYPQTPSLIPQYGSTPLRPGLASIFIVFVFPFLIYPKLMNFPI